VVAVPVVMSPMPVVVLVVVAEPLAEPESMVPAK
jgi:hypothetical protein